MPVSSVIEGGYLRDILAQPEAVRATVAGLRSTPELERIRARLAAGDFKRLVLTGMGGSFWALSPLQIHLLRHGRTPILVETSELIHTVPELAGADTLVVAVSQSGESVEMVRLLERKHAKCVVLAVTNTPGSTLARKADGVILTAAGKEYTVSCKTYLATLAALAWTARMLTGPEPWNADLEQASGAVSAYLEKWREHVAAAQAELAGLRRLFYLGRGTSLAAAGTGALITKESAHFHAEGMSAAAFRHGPLEMVDDGLYALVFTGDAATAPLNRNLVQDIRQAGGRAALVGEDAQLPVFRLPAVPASIRPLMEILPVEMITLALAALSGREAGKFEHATKVTVTE